MKNKKGVHITISLVIVLILVVMFFLSYFGFFDMIFFSGAPYDATQAVYENLEMVCDDYYVEGESEAFEIFIPDYTGNNRFDFKFYYVSISNNYIDNLSVLGQTFEILREGEVRLNSRSYVDGQDADCSTIGIITGKCRDPVANFVEWARDNPNQKKLRSFDFKNCDDKTICPGDCDCSGATILRACKSFSFEPGQNQETLSINITKSKELDVNGKNIINFTVEQVDNTGSDVIQNPPAYL